MTAEESSLQFPLHVSTEDEEFVIEKDGDEATSPAGPQFDGKVNKSLRKFGVYACKIFYILNL